MYWIIYIKMYSHDRQNWHWAECCRVESSEMLGIAEGSIGAYQTTKVEQHEYKTPDWANDSPASSTNSQPKREG